MIIDQNVLNATLQNPRIKIIKLELLNKDYHILDAVEGYASEGVLNVDSTSDTRQTLSLTMVPDNSFTSGYWTNKFGIDKYIRLSIGLNSNQSDTILWFKRGIFLFDALTFNYNASNNTLQISCLDLMAKLSDKRGCYFGSQSFKIEAGVEVRSFILDCIRTYGAIDNYVIDTPYDILSTQITAQNYMLDYGYQLNAGESLTFDGWTIASNYLNIPFMLGVHGSSSVSGATLQTFAYQSESATYTQTSDIVMDTFTQAYFSNPYTSISQNQKLYYKVTNTSTGSIYIDRLFIIYESNDGVPSHSSYVLDGTLVGMAQSYCDLLNPETKSYQVHKIPSRIPYDISFSDTSTIYDVLKKICDLYQGWEIFFDVDGYFRFQKIPDGKKDSITFNFNDYQSLIVSVDKAQDYSNAKNNVVIYGKLLNTGEQIVATVNDDNPQSPFYINGDCPLLTLIDQQEGITTYDLALQAGRYELYKHSNFNDQLSITCVPIYFMDANQKFMYTDNEKDIDGNFLVKSFNIPLNDSDVMTITSVKVYDSNEPVVDETLILYITARSRAKYIRIGVITIWADPSWTDRSYWNAETNILTTDGGIFINLLSPDKFEDYGNFCRFKTEKVYAVSTLNDYYYKYNFTLEIMQQSQVIPAKLGHIFYNYFLDLQTKSDDGSTAYYLLTIYTMAGNPTTIKLDVDLDVKLHMFFTFENTGGTNSVVKVFVYELYDTETILKTYSANLTYPQRSADDKNFYWHYSNSYVVMDLYGVRFYTRALTQDEIDQNVKAGF